MTRKRIRIAIYSFLSLMIVGLAIQPVLSAGPFFVPEDKKYDHRFVQDEIIVKFRNDSRPFQKIKVPSGMVASTIRKYLERMDVEYAEPNYIAKALWTPNDPYYSYQWHLDNDEFGGIEAEEAWDISSGEGVVIAIIDTGVAYENYCTGLRRLLTCHEQAPDLANTRFVAGYDFVNNDSHPNDDTSPGHGTHVAGTIAQSTNNATGVAGVAFNASIMPIKVLGSDGSGTYSDVSEGIRWAADNGAKVINLSLGGSASSETLRSAVEYAYNKGVTVIAAAGNDGSSTPNYPAAYDDYVISVGATQYDETLAPYSNYGSSVDVVAPGGNTSIDQNGDGYVDGVLQQTFELSSRGAYSWGYYFLQGTSMATPHVSGVAALVISSGNATTPDEVRSALQETADDLGAAGRDNSYGYGLVNAKNALSWNSGPVDAAPTISITSPADMSVLSGTVSISADASDDNGIARVDFYLNSNSIGTDDTSPYAIDWDSASVVDGAYTIQAIAIDTASQESSDSTSIIIDNVNDSPIADAGLDQSVSDGDGDGQEIITLNGSGSYDPDGTIASYEWKEGEAILGTAEIIDHSFAVGAHTVTLIVTDDKGAVSSDEAIVTVFENQAPTADAGPDQVAYAGDVVNFDGTGSSDSDGSITSYSWDFGDGSTAGGSTASHTYAASGDYVVTLSVTDNGGKTAEDTAVVHITDLPSQSAMHVGDISFTSDVRTWGRGGSLCSVTGSVVVLDSSGTPVKSADVTVEWSDAYANTSTSSTNGEGVASFRTGWVFGCGTFTLTVTDVAKDAWFYDSASNTETSDSVTLP